MNKKLTAKRMGVFAIIAALILTFAFCFVACAPAEPDETNGGEVVSIAVTKQPNKLEYEVGDKFNRSGMRVTATFADGTEKTILGYKIDKDGGLTLEDTVITITYQNCSTTVNITVREKSVPTQLTITSTESALYKVEAEDCNLASEEAGVDKSTHFEYHDENTGNPNTSGGISVGKLKEQRDILILKINSTVEANIDIYAALAYRVSLDFDEHTATYWNDEKIQTGWVVTERADTPYQWFDWQEYALKDLKLNVGINELRFEVDDDSALYDYFRIEVNPVESELTSIEVTTPPAKTEYKEGEIFDPAGMVVTGTYENGKKVVIGGFTYDKSALVLGENDVEISYNGLTTSVKVTATARDMTVVALEVDGVPLVTQYKAGDYFLTAGMIIKAHYSDGIIETVTDYTIDKTGPLAVTDSAVTVSYGGKSESIEITVTENEVAAHATIANAEPHTVRMEAENASIAYNKFGDTHNVENHTSNSANLSIGNMRGSTTSIKYYVDSEVATVADLTFRIAHPNLAFDTQAALYLNGVRMQTAGWQCSGTWFVWKMFTLSDCELKAGRNVIDIVNLGGERGDGGLQFDCVDVVVNPVREFDITAQPEKTDYRIGERFDTTGMVVTVTLADGTTKTVTDYTVTPDRSLTVEDTAVIIGYGGFTYEIDITVVAVAELESIRVDTMPTKTQYLMGEAFDPAGMVVTAVYEDGTEIAVTDYTVVTEYVQADTPVTISYSGKTTDVTVTAVAPEKTHLSFTTTQNKYLLEFEDATFEGIYELTIVDATANNPNASGGKWLDGFDGKPASSFFMAIYSEVEGTVEIDLSIATGAQGGAIDGMWDFMWNGVDFESGMTIGASWHPNGLNSMHTTEALSTLKLNKGYNYFKISIKPGSNVNMDCVRFIVTSDDIELPIEAPETRHITVTADESEYVLEFEAADFEAGDRAYSLTDNDGSSGGKFVDSMSGMGGATFTINIYSEVDGTVQIAFSIASGTGYPLDELWQVEWNLKPVATGITTPGAWIPLGENSEVTSENLGSLHLREGWNVLTITILDGSDINMDYFKLTVIGE